MANKITGSKCLVNWKIEKLTTSHGYRIVGRLNCVDHPRHLSKTATSRITAYDGCNVYDCVGNTYSLSRDNGEESALYAALYGDNSEEEKKKHLAARNYSESAANSFAALALFWSLFEDSFGK